MRAPRSRTATALVAALFTAAALVVAEAVLRLWAPIYTVGIQEAYQYDPEVGYRLKPGIHMFKTTDHQEEIRVNKLGTVNFQESFDGYSTLVFALGDSYTQGTGLPADASYPFQLDLILNRDANGLYSKRYAVVNLGLAAFGGEQSWRILRRYGSTLGKPAIVLYLGAENDYSDDLQFNSGYRHKYLVDGSPYWGWALRPLRWMGNTELGKRARLAVPALRRSPGAAVQSAGEQPDPVSKLEQPVLEKIAQTCKESNAVLVVGWASAPSASYDWLKSWATAKGILFADWWPAAQSVRAAVPSLPLENPHSGRHLRAWVARLIAEAYARQIQSLARTEPRP